MIRSDRAALLDVERDVNRRGRAVHFDALRRQYPTTAGDRLLALQSRRLAAIEALDQFHGRRTIFAAVALQEWLTRGFLDTAGELRRRD